MKIQKNNKTFIFAGLIIVLLILIVQFLFLSVKYQNQSESLKNQIEDSREKELLLEKNLILLNEQSNEVRRILSLPQSFLMESETNNDKEISPDANKNLSFYNAVDFIKTFTTKAKMENDFNKFVNSANIKEYFKNKGFKLSKTGPSDYEIFQSDNLYFTLRVDNSQNPVIQIISFEEINNYISLEEVKADNSLIFNYLDKEIPVIEKHYTDFSEMMTEFNKLKTDNQFLNFLKKHKLQISELKKLINKSSYEISNKDKSFIVKIFLDKINLKFNLLNSTFTDYSLFSQSLKQYLIDTDTRTEEIKVVDLAKIRIESVFAEESFKSYLNQNSLKIKSITREDNDYFYYDILDGQSDLIGSFAVQKFLGDIYLMDPEDIMISSLKYLETSTKIGRDREDTIEIPDNLPQIIDKYSNSDSSTFVVIGSHENNADTIIMVHADGISGKVSLIAIPRDLYYQDNKINDYYRTYGGEKFIDVLSDITGLNIEGYIAVDMYAFIDLINILGGIDITLQSDLIDPTYMVRDNGEWSTLFYTRGAHHLNGIESLRIARSRHSSSDFGRTSRQQLVLEGIKGKMALLDISDMGTILDVFRTLKKYLDTNFSSMELLSLFIKYKDSNLERKQGLSTFNVLYNTYTNIYKLKDKSKQYDEGFYRGYWILLPRKNDWNVIKWYIRSLIEENEN
jgi:polyisoprenyl-teichoic acid--peptidoglycan teichoic acid transferase